MAEISFIVGKASPLGWVEVDDHLPNHDNTLSCDVEFDGAVNDRFTQRFLTGEKIPTQIKTNFLVSGSDSITATLIDSFGNTTNLPVALIYQMEDDLDSALTAFYEFYVVGQPVGVYQIELRGISGGVSVYYKTEPFSYEIGETGVRYFGSKPFSYRYIKNHFKITSTNNENQLYSYFLDTGRLSGDPYEISIWVEGVFGMVDLGGEIDTYNNQGEETKLRQELQRIFRMKTATMPVYMLEKIQILAALDYFRVNDTQYVNDENGTMEKFGNLTSPVLEMDFKQKSVVGMNSDDLGFIIPNEGDMALVKPLQELNSNGSGYFDVAAGYSIHQINAKLVSGSSITLRLGITPGGDEITEDWEMTTSDPLATFNEGFMGDFDNSWKIYWSLTGVGSAGSIAITTIAVKQQI